MRNAKSFAVPTRLGYLARSGNAIRCAAGGVKGALDGAGIRAAASGIGCRSLTLERKLDAGWRAGREPRQQGQQTDKRMKLIRAGAVSESHLNQSMQLISGSNDQSTKS